MKLGIKPLHEKTLAMRRTFFFFNWHNLYKAFVIFCSKSSTPNLCKFYFSINIKIPLRILLINI